MWCTNISLSHHDLTSFQYYKATHKNDYQKETLGGIKPFWDDILPTPPTSFLRVWCGMCGMSAKESLFPGVTPGGVSDGDKSAQGQSRRPISGTHKGRKHAAESRSHHGLLVHLLPPDRAASAPLELPLLGVGQRGEDFSLFSNGGFFVILQEWWSSPQECVQKGCHAPSWCYPKSTYLLSIDDPIE